MDWLRCNRCFKAFFNAARSFSMTQCGHVYCTPCIGNMGEKCYVCGNIGFKLMPLTKPPKLEAMINYFAPLEDFIELGNKAIQFQDNQMAIAVRGAQQIEQKYTALKIEYTKVMSQTKELQAHCQKTLEEIKKTQRAQESLRHSSRNAAEKMEINSNNTPRHFQGHPHRSAQGYSTSGNPSSGSIASGFFSKYRETPRSVESSGTKDYKKTPTNPYNPNVAFSNVGYHSAGTTSDSSHSSVAANAVARVEGFLVPNVQRVPKSAATIKRKTPTGVRMSVPTEKDF